jgi:predicted NBD/HSP70 family sugar kinase
MDNDAKRLRHRLSCGLAVRKFAKCEILFWFWSKAASGTGIVFDGQVYRGDNGSAGEFGHMTIGQGAPVECASGSRECWEAFASERSALARFKNLSWWPKRNCHEKALVT